MKSPPNLSKRYAAFSLVEVMIATAVVGIFFVGLYTGIGQCFSILANAREDLRANQILLDKMEEMRLYNWDQINSYGTADSFIPSTFVEQFFPDGTNSASSTFSRDAGSKVGFVYHGTVSITNVAFANAYATNLRQVDVSVTWTNGARIHRHTMSTLVSEYGMQKYIY
jgi:prepilin-type N-terminal cleavage/methylation domain-containing protein